MYMDTRLHDYIGISITDSHRNDPVKCKSFTTVWRKVFSMSLGVTMLSLLGVQDQPIILRESRNDWTLHFPFTVV